MIKWAIGIVLGGMILLTGFQLVPVYINNMTISSIVEETIADEALKSRPKREVFRTIARHFRDREINHLDPVEVMKVARDKNGELVVDVKYEERRKLMYNLEIVAGFDEQFTN